MPVISKQKSYDIEARRGEGQPWMKVTDVQEDLLPFAQHWVARENYVQGGSNWRVAECERPTPPADPLPEREKPQRRKREFPLWAVLRFRLRGLFSPRGRR